MEHDLSMQNVLVERADAGVTVVTLNRPDKLNAMTTELVSDLYAALDEAGADPGCRVIVLTGAGRGFCAGLDLGGFGDAPDTGQGGGRVQRGFALVLGSDIRLAATSARFNAAFVRIGLSACDIGTSWLLPRLIGAARAQELMLTGRLFDAAEAERIGLVTEVADDAALVDKAMEKAALVARNSPFGIYMTKQVMWAALEIPGLDAAIHLENRTQIMTSFTEDHPEAIGAFLQKRAPGFQNR
jgi:enoyl-CoA hydratase